MIKLQLAQIVDTVQLRLVGHHGAVRRHREQRGFAQIGRLELGDGVPLRVVQHLVDLRSLFFRDARKLHARARDRHSPVEYHSHSLVGCVLDAHGITASVAQDEVEFGQAGVFASAEVEQAEEACLELVHAVERITHQIAELLGCITHARGRTT